MILLVVCEMFFSLPFVPGVFHSIVVGEVGHLVLVLILLVTMFILGSPIAFISGFVSGILYVLTETLWNRVSLLCRMGAWIVLGFFIPFAIVLILFLLALCGSEWEYEGGEQAIAIFAIFFGFFFGGIAAGIDGLRLAGLGTNRYMMRYIW